MTNDDIIKSAVSLSNEQTPTSSDYSARALWLLALIYNQCAPLDKIYRQANDLPQSTWVPATQIDSLNSDFPLSDVFLAVVPFALASLFVSDENSELSKQFFAQYVAGLAEIRRMIPASVEPIVDRYHLD